MAEIARRRDRRDGLPLRFTAFDGSAPGRPTPRSALHLTLPARRCLPRHRARATSAWRGPTSPATSSSTASTPATPTTRSALMGDAALPRPAPGRRRIAARSAARAARACCRRRRRRRRCPAGVASLRGCGTRKRRDAEAIHHHYDVSNRFYELVLGPSMTYTCACYPTDDATLEEAQDDKYDLVAASSRLKPGHAAARRRLRLGRHGPARRARARRHARSASRCRASRRRGRRRRSSARGSTTSPRCATSTTATCPRRDFDAVSSIGLTEHIGVRNYPAYFALPARPAAPRRPAAQPLHHPAGQPAAAPRRARSSTATSSPTVSSPGRARSSPRCRTPASRCATRRTCASTTPVTLRAPGAPTCVDELGRVRRRGRRGHRAGLGSLHGRLAARLRAQRDPAAPGARRQACTPTAGRTSRCAPTGIRPSLTLAPRLREWPASLRSTDESLGPFAQSRREGWFRDQLRRSPVSASNTTTSAWSGTSRSVVPFCGGRRGSIRATTSALPLCVLALP